MPEMKGEVVGLHIVRDPTTGASYGYVTIKSPEYEKVGFKIESSESLESMRIGDWVEVEYKRYENSDLLIASKIAKA
jgi:hypothetical protein